MHIYIRSAAAVLALLMLAGCNSGGGDIVNTSVSSVGTVYESNAYTSAEQTETVITTETVIEVTETTAPETTVETTVTEAPVTTTAAVTTVAATTAAPVPDTPTEAGVTANGYAISVVNGVTYVNGTLIANKTYALPETYAPGGLTDETYAAFVQMQSAASAEGLYLFVKSGYRSFYDQRYIYNGYVASDGVALADTYSARAGHSEHQSGMAIDVNSTYNSFADTPEGIWLRNNCHKFGFIIRYPQGKESITGYMYEPWHIRYVGTELAAAVAESGLCLEEYFGITSIYA